MIRTTQPQTTPTINWANPITQGLVGLIWTGPGISLDIINSQIPRGQNAGTVSGGLESTSNGQGTISSPFGGQTVYTTGFSGMQPVLAPWKMANPPLSFLTYGEFRGSGGTRLSSGVSSGGDGYFTYDLYGTNDVYVKVNTAAPSVLLTGGRWSEGTHITGGTHDGATLTGYDAGVSIGTASGSGAIGYDPSFTAITLFENAGGLVYWFAAWNRCLSPAEVLSLEQNPWQMFQKKTNLFADIVTSAGNYLRKYSFVAG